MVRALGRRAVAATAAMIFLRLVYCQRFARKISAWRGSMANAQSIPTDKERALQYVQRATSYTGKVEVEERFCSVIAEFDAAGVRRAAPLSVVC